MEGAANLLMKQRPIIYFECEMRHLERSGRSWEMIWKILIASGYAIWAESDGRFIQCSMIQPLGSNYLAVHEPPGSSLRSVVSVAEFISMLGTSEWPMK